MVDFRKFNILNIQEGEYVSDKIGDLDLINNQRDIILNLPLGSGKTYWAMNKVVDEFLNHGKKVLMLVHRTSCKFQMIEDRNNSKVWGNKNLKNYDIRTNQSIFYQSLQEARDFLDYYDLIIVDESHSFLSDSWTKTTQEQLRYIIEARGQKIYMSATNDDFIEYMVEYEGFNPNDIYYARDKFLNINSIKTFNNDEVENIIDALYNEPEEKTLVVINNIKQIKYLRSIYGDDDVLYNISTSNDEYIELVDDELVSELLINKTFPKGIKMVVSTTAIDAGVSIYDKDFKNIIISGVSDLSTIKQITGRKRKIDREDKVDVFIGDLGKRFYTGKKTEVQRVIDRVKLFREEYRENVESAILKYFLLNDDLSNEKLYYVSHDKEGTASVVENKTRVFYFELLHRDMELASGKDGLLSLLGCKFDGVDIYYIDNISKGSGLLERIEKMYSENVKFYDKKAKNELAEMIDYRINGTMRKGIDHLNFALKEENIPYELKNKRETRVESEERARVELGDKFDPDTDYRKRYWCLIYIGDGEDVGSFEDKNYILSRESIYKSSIESGDGYDRDAYNRVAIDPTNHYDDVDGIVYL